MTRCMGLIKRKWWILNSYPSPPLSLWLGYDAGCSCLLVSAYFSVFTSRRDVESHFLRRPVGCWAGVAGTGILLLVADLAPMLRLGLGARGGRGLAPVNRRPGGEEASLLSGGTWGAGDETWEGVDLPEDGRDWSLLTGILLGTAGNCLPCLLFTWPPPVTSSDMVTGVLSVSLMLTVSASWSLVCGVESTVSQVRTVRVSVWNWGVSELMVGNSEYWRYEAPLDTTADPWPVTGAEWSTGHQERLLPHTRDKCKCVKRAFLTLDKPYSVLIYDMILQLK